MVAVSSRAPRRYSGEGLLTHDAVPVGVAHVRVCDVLSPSTRKVDLLEKRPTYAREGVGHLWLIDPTDRTLEAFELHEGQWLLIASAKDDDLVQLAQ